MKFSNLTLSAGVDARWMERWIRASTDAGTDGIEILDDHLQNLDWCEVLQLIRLKEKLGLHTSSYTTHCNLTRLQGEPRDQEVARIRLHVDHAREWGAKIVRVLGNWEDIHEVWMSRTQAIAATVETIKACCDYAAKRDVILALENHPRCITLELADYVAILKEVPFPPLGVNLDIQTAEHSGGNTVKDFLSEEEISKRIVHNHFRDYKRCTDEHGEWKDFKIALGEGDYCVAEVIRFLKKQKFDGWISYENIHGPLDLIGKSAENVRRLWKEAE